MHLKFKIFDNSMLLSESATDCGAFKTKGGPRIPDPQQGTVRVSTIQDGKVVTTIVPLYHCRQQINFPLTSRISHKEMEDVELIELVIKLVSSLSTPSYSHIQTDQAHDPTS